MGDTVKSIDTYVIGDNLSVHLGNCSTKHNEYFSFDFHSTKNGSYFYSDTHNEPSFESYMSRDKLRGLAVFILNYLENK